MMMTSATTVTGSMTMTDEELVAVLRWRGSALQEGAFFAAADRIEALTAERDRLRAKLADAAVALDAAGMELSDFANCLSREPWAAGLAYEAAIDARAALKGESHE